MPLPVFLCFVFWDFFGKHSRFCHNYNEAVLILRPIENTLYWRLEKWMIKNSKLKS